jgi:multiple sugar transport system substrate-binding protein
MVLALVLSCGLLAEAKTKLTFVVNSDTSDQEAWQQLAAGYMRQRPDIEVEVLPIPWNDYHTKLSTMIAAGVVPDVVYYAARRVVGLAAAGALMDFSQVIKTLPNRQEYIPAGFEEVTLNNMTYGMPSDLNVSAMMYTVQLFDEAGLETPFKLWQKGLWNWDTFLAAAKRLSIDINGDGQLDQAALEVSTWAGSYPTWIWNNGASMLDSARRRSTLDDPRAIQAMQFVGDLINTHRVTSWGTQLSRKAGRVAMWHAGLNTIQALRTEQQLDWEIVPSPVGYQGAESYGTAFGGGYVIPASTKQYKEAWEFVQYLISPESEALRGSLAARMPIKRRGIEVFLEQVAKPGASPANLRTVIDIAATGRPLPITPRWDEMEKILLEETRLVWGGSVAAQTAMTRAAERINVFAADW